MSAADTIPTSGIVAVVKRDCPTCEMVAPILTDLAANDDLVVISQDDPEFPFADVIDDRSLEWSWRHDIETVPSLVRLEDGTETARIVGWSRPHWEGFLGQSGLGVGLPEHRPGCGSLSVDPEHATRLEATYGNGLTSRRVEFAELEDEIEAMYDRGWSDGLPLVPPTPERVLRMLEGTTRDPSEVVAVVPPTLVEATVEKIAVNAVMAGCKPEYLPIVITAVEAICTDEFNMHGLLATTMPNGPVLIVNGPIRHRIGLNSGRNVLGQGTRANSTIGRAVQLVVRNVGGGLPGSIDRSVHGSPAKVGFCFAEDEEGSPWQPLSADRGFEAGVDTVTVFAGEAPRIHVDQLSRTPEAMVASFAEGLIPTVSSRLAVQFDAILVISPEHMARFADAGWTKQQFRDALAAHLELDADSILRGTGGIAEGIPEAFAGATLPKFNRDGGLLVVHAGGDAGLFSSVIGGWVNGEMGSVPVTKEITP